MVGTVVALDFEIYNRISGDDPSFGRFLDSLVHGGYVLSGDYTTLDPIYKLVAATPWKGRDTNPTITVLATPTSLIALLRAIAFSWRQVSVMQNAEAIRSVGEEFYNRLSTLVDHLANIGKSLDRTVDSYNRAVGSLERSVLPSARRLSDMGVSSEKELDELQPVERLPREPANKETG